MGVEILLKEQALQFVLVLYHQSWQETPSRLLLTQFLVEHPDSHLLLVDNSPEPQLIPERNQARITYHHNPDNPGLATAYNQALIEATTHDAQWLVLLDQDTTLTSEYLAAIYDTQQRDTVVCRVPQIMANQHQISPLLADTYIDHSWHYPPIGVTNRRIMAINSATIWRVSFLKELGGFNLAFPLDFLDHWLCYQVAQQKKEVDVLPITLTHDLSVLHYQSMSIKRYQAIVAAEHRYYTTIEPALKKRHEQQLLKRTVKQFFTVGNRAIWRATWQSYCNMRRDKR